MTDQAANRDELVRTLKANWRRERDGARLYRALAEAETDARRRGVLLKLAAAEEEHASKWAAQLASLGEPLPDEPSSFFSRLRTRLWQLAGTTAALRQVEMAEHKDAARYGAQAGILGRDAREVLGRVRLEEKAHSSVIRSLLREAGPEHALAALQGRERWHRTGSGWVGDAIYGVNDGLGAVFGIVSGMAGYSGGGHVVVVAGMAGLLASALSMGSGAYLAAKSEREIYEAELARERDEISQDPEEEKQELELFYELSGLSEQEAGLLAERMAQNPEQLLKTLAHHELGLSEANFPNPIRAAVSSVVSTAVGALIPVIPFLFTQGVPAIVASAIISTLAHFAVGAAKTIITGRSWLASGMEMTVIGVAEATITYLIGLFLAPVH